VEKEKRSGLIKAGKLDGGREVLTCMEPSGWRKKHVALYSIGKDESSGG